jgi:hypothetical protein
LREFEKLGGERWEHAFKVKMGIRAVAIYERLYRKPPRKVRSSKMPGYRSKVAKYPCGILEQAYRELLADCGRGVQTTTLVAPIAGASHKVPPAPRQVKTRRRQSSDPAYKTILKRIQSTPRDP